MDGWVHPVGTSGEEGRGEASGRFHLRDLEDVNRCKSRKSDRAEAAARASGTARSSRDAVPTHAQIAQIGSYRSRCPREWHRSIFTGRRSNPRANRANRIVPKPLPARVAPLDLHGTPFQPTRKSRKSDRAEAAARASGTARSSRDAAPTHAQIAQIGSSRSRRSRSRASRLHGTPFQPTRKSLPRRRRRVRLG